MHTLCFLARKETGHVDFWNEGYKVYQYRLMVLVAESALLPQDF